MTIAGYNRGNFITRKGNTMKLNGPHKSALIWGSTMPLWSASAAFNMASGNTGLAALNVGLVVLNGFIAYSNLKQGNRQIYEDAVRDARTSSLPILPDLKP